MIPNGFGGAAAAMCLAIATIGVAPEAYAQSGKDELIHGYVVVDNVNARNGNFAITYPAFDHEDGIAYRRTYNSRSLFDGVFGLGWGSSFDTTLVVLGGDRVAVIENGNGALTSYGEAPNGETPAQFERAVRTALERRRSGLGALTSMVRGLFQRSSTPTLDLDGSRAFEEQVCPRAAISRYNDLWWRVRCDGVVDVFRSDGRLVETGRGGTQQQTLTWRGERLMHVQRADGGELDFRYAGSELQVVGQLGGRIVYTLDPDRRNTMVDAPDSGRLLFRYDGHTNMTRIQFVDTTHRDITYDNLDRAVLLEGRNGERTNFVYGTDRMGRPRTEVTQRRGGQDNVVRTYVFD